MKRNPVLEINSVSKSFGGLIALSDITLDIQQGEICGLIGPNGAGKTTLFNILTGIYSPDAGGFRINGRDCKNLKPHLVVKAGLARTFQNIRLFGNMTGLENVMVGCHVRTRVGVVGAIFRNRYARDEEKHIEEKSKALMEYVGLDSNVQKLSNTLSYGDQRRLEIARALATDPTIIALDEPAAGMNATETSELRDLLTRIRKDGITILLIEHDVKLVMGLCNRVAVLDYGVKIAEGKPEDIKNNSAVIKAYLGASLP